MDKFVILDYSGVRHATIKARSKEEAMYIYSEKGTAKFLLNNTFSMYLDNLYINQQHNKYNLSKTTRIRRTINALSGCYSNQKLDRELIVKCLHSKDFQIKYVQY